MSDLNIAVDALRRLAVQLYNLPEIANALEKLASAEDNANEQAKQLDRLTAEKTLVLAELAEVKSGVLLIRDQGEKLVREAEDHSQSLLNDAKETARNLLLNAKEEAKGYAQSELDNVKSQLNSLREACEVMSGKLNDLSSESQVATEGLLRLASDTVEAELKLKSVKDELAAIFARHRGE